MSQLPSDVAAQQVATETTRNGSIPGGAGSGIRTLPVAVHARLSASADLLHAAVWLEVVNMAPPLLDAG